MKGAAAIVAARIAKRQVGEIPVTLDEAWSTFGYELVIEPGESLERLDLRCVMGLDVCVRCWRAESAERLDRLVALLERAGARCVTAVRVWHEASHPNFIVSSTRVPA